MEIKYSHGYMVLESAVRYVKKEIIQSGIIPELTTWETSRDEELQDTPLPGVTAGQ